MTEDRVPRCRYVFAGTTNECGAVPDHLVHLFGQWQEWPGPEEYHGFVPAQPTPPLDVDLVAATLQEMWRVRDAQGHFVYDIPVPPDEQTARTFASVYARLGSEVPR